MKPQTKTLLIVITCIIVLAILLTLAINLLQQPKEENNNPTNFSDNTAIRIIDGDTFELYSGDIVRLICVDAPETGKTGADEATEFLSSLILNKELKLETDIDNKDNYGRLLRYVYINNSDSEEIFVNKMIVQQGYGSLFIYGNDTAKCGEIEELR